MIGKKKMKNFILILSIIFMCLQSCKKGDGLTLFNDNQAILTLTISGESKPFQMSNPDLNQINRGSCQTLPDPPDILDYIQIINYNGRFELRVGDNPVTNMTYMCEQLAQDWCGTPQVNIYVDGDLQDELESIYNEPIFRLDAKGKTNCYVSKLTADTITMNWAGKIEVLGYNSILGTHDATFIVNNVPIEDKR